MSILRNTVGTAIAGAAQGLNLASKVLEATAKTLRPSQTKPEPQRPTAPETPEQGSDTAARADEVTDNVTQIGRVAEPPGTPVLDETPHLRTSESHIAELADKPAAEVIEAVSGLSTDELRLLTEFESDHKNRRTVLAAIEKALTPPTASSNGGGSSARSSSAAKRAKSSSKTKSEQREIVLPDAGGVPTSGTIDAAKS